MSVVQVWCIINPSFNLTEKVEKNVGFAGTSHNDQFQSWIIRTVPGKRDAEGHQAFTLTDACSGKVMKYNGIDQLVPLVRYARGDDTQLWTCGYPKDNYSSTVRPFSDIGQCLTADIDNGTIHEDTKVRVSSATGANNQLWKLAGHAMML